MTWLAFAFLPLPAAVCEKPTSNSSWKADPLLGYDDSDAPLALKYYGYGNWPTLPANCRF